MNNSKHSDVEIEILLLGKWRFQTASEKITIEFKDDMTYEQTRVQISLFSKPKELITGNKFTGIWYVNQKRLHLNVTSIPKSAFNFKIPLMVELSIADMIATLVSLFMPEYYEVLRINESKFLIQDQEQSIIGLKINTQSHPNFNTNFAKNQ